MQGYRVERYVSMFHIQHILFLSNIKLKKLPRKELQIPAKQHTK